MQPGRRTIRAARAEAELAHPELALGRARAVHHRHHAGTLPGGGRERATLRERRRLPPAEPALELGQERGRVHVAHHHQHRVVRPHPAPVPGGELVAPGGLRRGHRPGGGEGPGVPLAEDRPVEHRLANLRRVRLELGEVAEPERAHPLEVWLLERRVEHAVAEDVQDGRERGRGEGDGGDERVLVGLGPEQRGLVLEGRGDCGRVVERGALVEHVAHEARGARLAGRVGVLAGADHQLHRGQRHLVLLDDPHREAVLQRSDRGDGRLERHWRPGLGERLPERSIRGARLGHSGVRAGCCGRRRAGGGGRAGRGAGEEEGGGEQREAAEAVHGVRPHWAEAVRAAPGLTMSTTRASDERNRRAASCTWAAVTAR